MAFRCLRYDIGNPLRGISDWSLHSNGYYKWHICIVQVLIKVSLKFDLRTSSGTASFIRDTNTLSPYSVCSINGRATQPFEHWRVGNTVACVAWTSENLSIFHIATRINIRNWESRPSSSRMQLSSGGFFSITGLPCCASCPQTHHRLCRTTMPAIRLSNFRIHTRYSIDIWHLRLRLNWMENLITTYYCAQQWSALNNIITAYSVLVISIESPYFVNAINLDAWK